MLFVLLFVFLGKEGEGGWDGLRLGLGLGQGLGVRVRIPG